MIPALLCSVVSIALGTLYPAYASYKAIKTKKSKNCIQWMMYWVVFAIFTSVEPFLDFFFSFWFPFYNEIKIVFLLWLLSPLTEGSSLLYRKFVHTILLRREKEIDNLITVAQTSSYNTAIEISKKGVKYVTELVTRGVEIAPGLVAQAVSGVDQIGFGNEGETRSERRNRGDGDIVVPSDTVEYPVAPDNFLSDDEIEPQVIPPASDEPVLALTESDIESSTSQVTQLKKHSVRLAYSSGSDSDDPTFEPAEVRQIKTNVSRNTATRRSTRKKQQ